jgi:hypothetical protein
MVLSERSESSESSPLSSVSSIVLEGPMIDSGTLAAR